MRAGLLLLRVSMIALSIACGEKGSPAGPSAAPLASASPPVLPPPAWNATYARPTDGAAAASRASCAFARGCLPIQTLGPSTPVDADLPIEHIIVVMQENHSFDTYLGHLAAYEAAHGVTSTIESAPDDATNPADPVNQPGLGVTGGGALHRYAHAPERCFFDTAHRWVDEHVAYDLGANDGFYFASNQNVNPGVNTVGIDPKYLSGDRTLGWYDERDIPFYYALYSTFAMGDHYHSDVLGPTYPNRMYLYAATSFGVVNDSFPDLSRYPYPGDGTSPAVLFDELEERGISWTLYAEGPPAAGVVLGNTTQTRYGRDPLHSVDRFISDAAAGTLPEVAFVDANFWDDGVHTDDEHPPSEIEIGQQFVWKVVNAVTTSPSWSTSALFLTYDENGGTYDHVPPPPACVPDGVPPNLDAVDSTQPGGFDRYGFRVPFVVVSPYAKRSFVSHATYSHASITRFIEAKARVPALSRRDANADPFTDLFDWKNPPFMTPPVFAKPTIDEAAVATCAAELTATPASK